MALAKSALEGADFIVASEPNIKRTRNKRNTYTNDDTSVSIIRLNQNHQVYAYGSGTSFVWIETKKYRIYSVYISPNISDDAFKQHLEELWTSVKEAKMPVLITGDFNAKHVTWGGTVTDTRGVALLEWIHSLDLNLLNDGKVPTLVRSTGKSWVDITAVSEEIMREVTEWKVLDRESLSGHKQIKLVLAEKQHPKNGAWRYGRTDIAKFCETLKLKLEDSKYPKDIESCSRIMQKGCQDTTCKKSQSPANENCHMVVGRHCKTDKNHTAKQTKVAKAGYRRN